MTTLAPTDMVARFAKLGIDCLLYLNAPGKARNTVFLLVGCKHDADGYRFPLTGTNLRHDGHATGGNWWLWPFRDAQRLLEQIEGVTT